MGRSSDNVVNIQAGNREVRGTLEAIIGSLLDRRKPMAALIVILISSLLILAAALGLIDAVAHLAVWIARRIWRLVATSGQGARLAR
jgi:hypothetical protein